MRYVISYDISSNKRRARTARVLSDFGTRVQFSVFECELSPKQVADLQERLAAVAGPASDSLRIYAICDACAKRVTCVGQEVRVEPADVVVV